MIANDAALDMTRTKLDFIVQNVILVRNVVVVHVKRQIAKIAMKIEVDFPDDVIEMIDEMMNNFPNIGNNREEYIIWCVEHCAGII